MTWKHLSDPTGSKNFNEIVTGEGDSSSNLSEIKNGIFFRIRFKNFLENISGIILQDYSHIPLWLQEWNTASA